MEFFIQARLIRLRFKRNHRLLLNPQDFSHMQRNRVHLTAESEDPADAKYYSSKLVCRICDFWTDDICEMQRHCASIQHKRILYRLEIKERYAQTILVDSVTSMESENSTWEGDLTPKVLEGCRRDPQADVHDGQVIDSLRTKADGRLYDQVCRLFRTSQQVNYFICELCQVSLSNIEQFLLHLTGYGHAFRRKSLESLGEVYYQAFWDPRIGSLFFLRHNDYTIHTTFPRSSNGIMHAYSQVTEVSVLGREFLRDFIQVVQ
jgi:hypothetical protein